jgi:hypothetical protein
MDWFSFSLAEGYQEDLDGVLSTAWTMAYADAPLNYRIGVFRKSEAGRGATVYFSPWAHWIAEAFSAEPCGKPDAQGMTLLIGDDRTWEACFPERKSGGRIRGTLKLPRHSSRSYSESQSGALS